MTSRVGALDLWEPTTAHRRAVALVAESHGLLPGALVSRKRTQRLIVARFAALWVLRAVWPHLSSVQLGKVMGNRDHSTVLYALRRVAAMRAADKAFRRKLNRLASRVALARSVREDVPLAGPMVTVKAARRRPLTPEQRALAALQAELDSVLPPVSDTGGTATVPHILDERYHRMAPGEVEARREARHAELASREAAWLERERPGLNGRKALPLSAQVC